MGKLLHKTKEVSCPSYSCFRPSVFGSAPVSSRDHHIAETPFTVPHPAARTALLELTRYSTPASTSSLRSALSRCLRAIFTIFFYERKTGDSDSPVAVVTPMQICVRQLEEKTSVDKRRR